MAAAVARRAGLGEDCLDEVRLAVGEACLRAVELHRKNCPHEPVVVLITDTLDRFEISVRDSGGRDDPPGQADLDQLRRSLADPDGDHDLTSALPAGMGLAVISGLVEDLTITPGETGLTVDMSWPLA